MNGYVRLRASAAIAVYAVGCMFAAAVFAAPAGAASPVGSVQFRTVDVPMSVGSYGSPPASTQITGVNNAGTLVGTWQGVNQDQHGFIQEPDGQIISFNAPNGGGTTTANAINDEGTVVGSVCNPCGATLGFNGFVRSPDGSFTELNDPLAPNQTQLHGINDHGEIVGQYDDATGQFHGFLYAHGKFTTVDPPGSVYTRIGAINNSGTIVGEYVNAVGFGGGFRYENGKFTELDAPATDTKPFYGCFGISATGDWMLDGTVPLGISAGGLIVGNVCNTVGNGLYGWALSHGHFSPLNDPNAAPGSTFLGGINENGTMVAGTYVDAAGVNHGLVATITP
jgi:probable HAF family extracellular repeat protein